MKIDALLSSLEASIPRLDEINEKISKASVGWHIDHSCRVIMSVCKAIKSSDPNTYSAKFSLTRNILLFVGRFPRGKAKAPKITLPTGEITAESLTKQLEIVRAEIPTIQSLHPNAYFYHPIFKQLNLKRTNSFLEFHTTHHVRIIEDILR